MLIKKNWPILLILIIGILLRFYMLGSIPSVLNRDEAAIGYNAYSLLETGRDEFGEKWPLVFKSFGDYKMPGYIYLIIPIIKFLNLNNFSVRLLSAICGTLNILIIYWLAEEWFKNKKISLYSAFGLAVSPWAVFYSRIAFETNVAILFISTSFLLLFKGLNKPWLWLISAVLMVLALLTYNHSYIVIPIMLLIFLGLYYKNIFSKRNIFSALISLMIISTGGFLTFKTVWQVNQAKGMIAVYNDPLIHQEWVDQRVFHENLTKNNKGQYFFYKLTDNQYTYYGKIIFTNILKNFSPIFLTIRDSKLIWNGIQGIGFFYYIDSIFIVIGLIILLKNIKNKKSLFLISLLLAGTLPSALTIHQAHPNRSLNMFWGLYLVIGLGINYLLKKNYKKINIFIGMIYFLSILLMIERYFVFQPKNYTTAWFNKIDQSITIINNLNPNEIILSQNLDEVYIFYLFYSKYPPLLFQKTVIRTRDNSGFYTVHGFGNIRIKLLKDFSDFNQEKMIILGSNKDRFLLEKRNSGGKIVNPSNSDLFYGYFNY